jgi:hypothetical protein
VPPTNEGEQDVLWWRLSSPRTRHGSVGPHPGHSAAGETGISPAPRMTDTVIHRGADADTRDPRNARQPPWMVGTL